MPEYEDEQKAETGSRKAGPALVLASVDANLDVSIRRLFEFLRIPSVGTDPGHDNDCRAAVGWLVSCFSEMGFATTIMPTTGQPAVIAKYQPHGIMSKPPHVLFYGHYDVQPSEPDALWTTPPYQPDLRKNKRGEDAFFARGAADDKGQLMTFVEATRAWLAIHGSLPFSLTILIEGDEEGDNVHLDRFVAANRDLLKADIALICDTGMWDDETPCIVTGLRGCIGEEVTVTGPRIDLHSGYFGGPAVNPIKALSKIIAGMHDKNGRVAIPGFYDGIKLLTPARRKQLKRIPFDQKAYMDAAGIKNAAGEKGYSVLEQKWLRPTCEVNGIHGGYTLAGAKTVLPATAFAKFTFRLVEGQKAAPIRKNFRALVKKLLPPDCKASFLASGGTSTGIRVADDSQWISMGRKVLTDEWGKAPVLASEGGSIPVVESFKKHLGMDSLLMGFGRADDNVHSPDEKYDVSSFRKGIRSWARLIAEIEKRTIN